MLISRGPQTASAATTLLENFASLPELNQQRLLTGDWPKLASLSMAPFLISIAKGRFPAADTALLGLMALELEAEREIVIERIRSGNVEHRGIYGSDKSMMLLPDETRNAWHIFIYAGGDGESNDAIVQLRSEEGTVVIYGTDQLGEK
jgi:hypothetical protein